LGGGAENRGKIAVNQRRQVRSPSSNLPRFFFGGRGGRGRLVWRGCSQGLEKIGANTTTLSRRCNSHLRKNGDTRRTKDARDPRGIGVKRSPGEEG